MSQQLPQLMLDRLLQSLRSEFDPTVTESAISRLLEAQEPGDIQENVALLICCYAESAKIDLSADDLSDQLQRVGLARTQCEEIVKTYQKYKTDLRKMVLRIGWHPPHVLKADWKFYHGVKGSSQGTIAKPSYSISLKVQDCDSSTPKDIVFNCNVEQLQDLVWKLKEATKLVQSTANQAS